MKLRNKKTGGLANILGEQEFFRVYTDAGWADYGSLAELNEEWEDYTPKEPLIKDEKIRKVVRAWAEANGINPKHYYKTDVKFDFVEHQFKWINTSIEFNDITGLENLEGGKIYTIDELCGEEEEE